MFFFNLVVLVRIFGNFRLREHRIEHHVGGSRTLFAAGGVPPKGGVGENPFPPSERLQDNASDNDTLKATFPPSLFLFFVT